MLPAWWCRALNRITRAAARPPHRGKAPRSCRPRLESLEDRLAPAAFTVQNLNDAGAGSLRQALLDANNDTDAVSDILFDPGLTGTISLDTALPHLTHDVTLTGPGAALLTVQRSTAGGTPDFNIFNVDAGVTAAILGLTVSNGRAPDGGGIFNRGTLFLQGDVITGNTATNVGGGLANDTFPPSGSNPSLTLVDSTVSNNTTSNAQGAAGIDSEAGTLVIINSTVSGNQSVESHSAGGVGVYGGSATISNSTIAGNTMSDTSGFATSAGGLDAGASVSLFDTIIAGNTSSAVAQDVMGVVTSQGHNLVGNGDGSTGLVDGINNDQVGSTGSVIDAHLGPLQDNGGPTPTMALLSGSPALDAGDNTDAPPSDQRGFVRVFNTTVDIGAFEAQSPELVATTTAVLLNTASPAEGHPLSFITSVGEVLPGAAPATPGGTAHVSVDGGAPSDVTVTGGTAAFDLPGGLAHGSHTIDVVYDGDGTFAGSSSGTTFTVAAAAPATTPVGVTVARPLTGDVTALVTVTRVPGPHGKGKPVTTLTLTLVNGSGQVIEGPITVVLNGLRPTVKLLGASGFSGGKKHRRPFVVQTPAGNLLQPGGQLSFLLRFRGRPNHFTTTVEAGPANP